MPQKTKASYTALTQASVKAASRTGSAKQKSLSMSMEMRKKQAEEPLYLYRM